MKYNLHTHTYRCNHADGTDRQYVEAAIEAGFDVLGFSDHCPQFFPEKDYYSFFRMFPEQAAGYAESVRRLQREYAADIKILLGFEAEYYPSCFDAFTELIRPLGLDYLIMGQHFVGNEYDEGSFYSGDRVRGKRFLTRYVSQTIEGLETGMFTYLAHPDIVNFQGSDEFYIERMTALCEYCRDKDVPLEFNMLGYHNGRNYPDLRFWNIAAEVGNKVVIGYDAHSPEVLSFAGVEKDCREILARRGMRPLDFEELILKNEKL